MIDIPRRRSRQQSLFSSLIASMVAMAAVAWVYLVWTDSLAEDVFSPQSVAGLAMAAAMCWCGMLSSDGGWGDSLTTSAGRTFAASGFVLLVQYPLAYFFQFEPTPWPIIVGGCIVAAALTGALEYALGARTRGRGILLVGFDATANALAESFPGTVCGVLDEDGAHIPATLRYLGNAGRLEEVLAETRAQTIVLSGDNWRVRVTPAALLRLRDSGIEVAGSPGLYESALTRVPWQTRHPVDLLLDSAPNQFRSVSAIQAIYTNVIGLSFLLALAPFFILVSIAIVALSPGGPIMEQIECLGYQGVPFRMFRFRMRDRDGQMSPVGKLLEALNAVNLPRLINVVRGEMALFGPPPARREFARTLNALIPAYSHRFMVKPGVSGWSQLHLRGVAAPEETVRLEYDLYYAKMGSAMLDASIVLRLIFLTIGSWIPRRAGARSLETA